MTSAVAMISPKFYGFDPETGNPLAFGKVYTYAAGTNTPKPTWQSEDGVVANTNPVILNGAGYADIYLRGRYKIVVKDAGDVEVWTADPVSDASSLLQPWIQETAATQVAPNQFKVTGNKTDVFRHGRAVKLDDTVTFYATVTGSAYMSGETTVTIDAVDNLTSDLSRVWASMVDLESMLPVLQGNAGETLVDAVTASLATFVPRMEQRFNLLLANSGYEFVGSYQAGIEITEYNQVLRDTAGELWRAAATTTLPYTTDGTGLPEGGAFVAVGDADIRNDLAAGVGAGKGGLLVRGAVIYVDTIADLQALDTNALVDGQSIRVRDSTFIYSSTQSKSADGGVVFHSGSGQFTREFTRVYPSFWASSSLSDGEMLQKAINYSIENDYPAVAFERMYDATGYGSILINKPRYSQRRDMYFLGDGGGIIKNDAGILFTSDLADTSEFVFRGVRFGSTEGAGTILFDYNKMINVCSYECEYKGVDRITYSDTRYSQGLFFKDNRVFGGAGYAFSFTYCYAFFFNGNVIEARSGGFVENNGLTDSLNSGLSILDNLIEGLGDIAIVINGGSSVNIKNNYFELNALGQAAPIASHIVFRHPGYGHSIEGNLFYNTQAQKDNSIPNVRFDHLGGEVSSRVNQAQSGAVLYSFKGESTVNSLYDVGAIISDSKIYMSRRTSEEGAYTLDGDVRSKVFDFLQQDTVFTSGQVNAGSTATFTKTLIRPISIDTMISARVFRVDLSGNVVDDGGDNGLSITYSIANGTNMRIRVTNSSATDKVARGVVNVLYVGNYTF